MKLLETLNSLLEKLGLKPKSGYGRTIITWKGGKIKHETVETTFNLEEE
jgi:hypothetical protein